MKMRYIDKFLKRKNVPYSVQVRVKKYLEYSFESDTFNFCDEDIFENISHNLKDEILTFVHGNLIKKIPIFYYIYSSKFIQKILFFFEEELYGPEENIFSVKLFNIIFLY